MPISHSPSRRAPFSRRSFQPAVAACNHRREAFQVQRVHDPGAGRVDAEPVQRRRCPLHEAVAFAVAAVFVGEVAFHRPAPAEEIDRERVVRGHVHRQHGVEKRRVEPGLGQRRAHPRDVHQRRAAGGVVHEDPARQERDFRIRRAVERGHDRGMRRAGVGSAGPQHVFQQDAVDVGHPPDPARRRGGQVDDPVAGATQRQLGLELHRLSPGSARISPLPCAAWRGPGTGTAPAARGRR